ncbi:hypothetical protein [Kitasatospora phosalacinea]|uniref:Uncharacterized protein n=1 Tax=Kitasatospora phosalacinea TaxID=2065 RepID=A0A9W6PNW5_9ACTN|nr:hypothetical protein [Kitasatospora phosalacinea]GLW58162.1 hypothetical protein Kpho01_61730 [Kitasatospora phosalacinea]
MPKSRSLSGNSVFGRRLLIGLGVLLAAALLAGLAARLAGGGHADHPAASPTATQPAPAPSTSSAGSDPGPGVARPAHTSSPTDYAAAFAQALWSYDTRALDQQNFVNGLRQWLTSESQYADAASVEAQVPDPVLWSRMHDNGQSSGVHDVQAHLPDGFRQAVAQDPGALTRAYIYAVTVTGTVDVAWSGGGRGGESRALTLAVQCRPQQDCALAAIAPTVYP